MTKVYVSATFRDLQDCRAAVQLALRRLRVEDMAMESYVAEDRRPLEKCLADVAECEVYVGIFAWRYGFVPAGYDKSITELEYREAMATGKPCLIFLLDEDAPWPRTSIDRGADADKIEALRAELAARHTCSIFTNPPELAALVTAAVANCLAEFGVPAHGAHALSEDTVRRYFDRLRQHYGVLDLDALTPAQTEDYLRIQLTSVFVEQSVREDPPPAELPREWLQRMQAERHIGTEDVPEEVDPAELVHLHEAYRAKPLRRLFDVLGAPDQRTVVLLGDPGAGKSTVARYLALSLAESRTDERLAVLANHLPLLIELRSFVTLVAEGRCQSFLDYLDHRAAVDGLGIDRAALQQHLSRGHRVVAIFDGLDEVFDRRRREEVASQIASFAADHPQARVIVTSRIIGYSRRILTDVGFTHFTLQDLDDRQIDEFLAIWYRLAIHDRPEDARARRARLLDAMRHSHAIRELAGSPLLLTILAIIGKHQTLPRERWRLYDHAATVLVEQWDVNRHLHNRSMVLGFIDAEDKKELLRRLAYRMQAAERGLAVNYIAAEQLSEVFERYLIERYQRDPATARLAARQMIAQFRERNFILSRYGPRLYGFVHRTFLEFFCADALLVRFQHDQELTFDELKDLFRQHWADLSWREVLRLLAGAVHEKHSAQLIQLLAQEVNQPWPPAGFAPPPWNLALAAQCLAEVRNLYSDVAAPAEALLRKIILLLEHCVAIDDRETAGLIEEEILPAAKAIGPNWPGREVYLSWYRRRGVRVVWSSVSAHAARLAAMLSTPAERIDDLFDQVLGAMDESPASYASVAGLAEVAQLANAAVDSPAHQAAAARAQTSLVKRARDDGHASVRLAAVQAIGERFGTDQRALELLVERARADGYAGVRLAAVQALGERFHGQPGVRELLRERASADERPSVRRAAVQALGDYYGGTVELRAELLECLRGDRDAEVVQTAALVLMERFGATRPVREILMTRANEDRDPVLRRTTVRVLGERLNADPQVRTLLLERVGTDREAGVLWAAGQALVQRSGSDTRLCDLLGERVRTDADEAIRRAALRLLVECFRQHQSLGELLVTCARRDRDADVRLLAGRALADRLGVDPVVAPTLGEMARGDGDSRVRLVAVQSLVDRVGMDPTVSDLLAGLARDDENAAVRLASVSALADLVGSDARVRLLLIECARDENDPEVRLAATRAIAREAQAHADVYGVLVDRARRDPDAAVFTEAVTAMLHSGGRDTRAFRLLHKRVRDDSNARIRLAAVQLLVERFGAEPEVRGILLDRVRSDRDADLVQAAAVALAKHLGTDGEQCEVLVKRANSDDALIRVAAVRTLGEHFGADGVVRELLIEKARHDSDLEVRREALRVLGEHLAELPEVRELFVERVSDHDWSVRAAAVKVLGKRFGIDQQIRALLIDLARDDPDPGFRRLAGQALTWLPGADPDHLPDLA
ncbi:HEAT repeat domain-containing protein [Micromonospora sp. NPDC003197]